MKHLQFVFLISALAFLISCSPNRQLVKSAKQTLETPVLSTAHVGISIFEPATGKYWYSYQGDHYFMPASNTKIPTCYAAMKYLGDSITGAKYFVENGELNVVGTGDPGFLHPDFKDQPVYEFLKNAPYSKISLIEQGTPYQSAAIKPYGRGWTWSDWNEDYMPERSFFPIYGNVARLSLRNGKVTVAPSVLQNKLLQPAGNLKGFYAERSQWSNWITVGEGSSRSQEVPIYFGSASGDVAFTDSLLADTLHRTIYFAKAVYPSDKSFTRIHSEPTDSLLHNMMHRSDNFFAEQTLLMVSESLLGYMNDRKIIDTLLKTDYKDLPQPPSWVDGSGLSRYNLFSPNDFVYILSRMKADFGMERIKGIFATGGTGTIKSYYQADAGFIYAKTGTLSGVVSLSGFLETKKHHQLVFSFLVNNHNGSATDVRRAVEKFIKSVREKY